MYLTQRLCHECKQYFMVQSRKGANEIYCENCKPEVKRRKTRERVKRYRTKKGNAPTGQASRGNSLNEVDTKIAFPIQAVNTNSLNRFSQGREGWAKPPLAIADFPLPKIPTLEELGLDFATMTALIREENKRIFSRTGEPVIHASNMRKITDETA